MPGPLKFRRPPSYRRRARRASTKKIRSRSLTGFRRSRDEAERRLFRLGYESLPIEAASIECDAHPSFPAPDDVTRPLQWMGWNDERKALGDEKRGYDFERGASLGEVANRAIDRAAAERDRSGLEDAVTRSHSMLIHDGTRDGIRWVANHPRKQKLTGGLQRTN